jgi:hypothetical protein
MSIGFVESTADYSLPLPLDQGRVQSALPLPSLRTVPVTHKHKYIRLLLYRLFAICLPSVPPNIAVNTSNTSHSLHHFSI